MCFHQFSCSFLWVVAVVNVVVKLVDFLRTIFKPMIVIVLIRIYVCIRTNSESNDLHHTYVTNKEEIKKMMKKQNSLLRITLDLAMLQLLLLF